MPVQESISAVEYKDLLGIVTKKTLTTGKCEDVIKRLLGGRCDL